MVEADDNEADDEGAENERREGRPDAQLARIESEIRQLAMGRELLLGLVTLLGLHIVAIRVLVLRSGGDGDAYSWTALGGLGTLAVWFACATRPLAQRITRASVAIAVVGMMSLPALSRLMLPQQRSQIQPRYFTLQLNGFQYANHLDSTPTILLCWLVGATVSAFAVHWFFGMRLVPPDLSSERKPLSLRSIFLLIILAALVSTFIRGPNWQNRISYFTNGATLGLVASVVAYSIFSTAKWTSRLAVPLATMSLIVVCDLTVGRLTNMWSGNLFNRLAYVGVFVTTLGISPAVSFFYLKQLGYRMQVKR